MAENYKTERIYSVDILRGLVMMIMLLDHTREYVHHDALIFSPTDLTKTDVVLFFTRWITHFCAPTFVFLSGTSIYLQRLRGKSTNELSKFLAARGLWFILLEFTVVRLSIFFDFDYGLFGVAEVIWVFGVSMVIMAALVWFPTWIVGGAGVLMIAFHNLLDSIAVSPATSMAGTPPPDLGQSIWLFLHQPGFVVLFGGSSKLFVAYPLIPWAGVMAAGYWLGTVYSWEGGRRRNFLVILGLASTILFVLIRFANIYGDLQPWSLQPDGTFTFLSFLNTTKYPASLLFLLMTLGPALLFLAWSDRAADKNLFSRVLMTYGRVPLFYFILQMFAAHAFGVILGLLAGKDVGFWFTNFPFSDVKAPEDAGFPLWVVYAAWIAGLALLYPLCKWYGNLKRQRRRWIFSYL